ncbi:KH homology domain-containing protein 4-like [Alosa sapidissima]|uniref:KH homology domain-containing protein 4-like n=1 Tax=Alosa sapidissima TaxID=34773 RepID=UPI001C08EF3F|nr:KH homology domain-containing protein 4-like [Alosa sapidissima]
MKLPRIPCELSEPAKLFDQDGGRRWKRTTPLDCRAGLIRFRAENEKFTKKKYASKLLWEKAVKDLGLEGKMTGEKAAKKWENLKKWYKDLKQPKTGSGTDSGETTASNWRYYEAMHAVLGGRPAIDPPVIVASFKPAEDPTSLLMAIVTPEPEPPEEDISEAGSTLPPTTPIHPTAPTTARPTSSAFPTTPTPARPTTSATTLPPTIPAATRLPTTPSPKKRKRGNNKRRCRACKARLVNLKSPMVSNSTLNHRRRMGMLTFNLHKQQF